MDANDWGRESFMFFTSLDIIDLSTTSFFLKVAVNIGVVEVIDSNNAECLMADTAALRVYPPLAHSYFIVKARCEDGECLQFHLDFRVDLGCVQDASVATLDCQQLGTLFLMHF